MEILPLLRRAFVLFALVLAGLSGWTPAAHASIDDFISVYQKIEGAAPPGSLPVSSADVIAYKSLFTCVEGGKDVIVCTDEFHDTDAGKKAGDSAEIPEAVWQVMKAYVAWKEGDTWGVIQYLGTAAACAVLQVLAGGADLCGLIDDLVDAAKELLEAGKAVAKFLAAVGGVAVDAINSVGCALDLWGDCDDEPPPPPPEVSAYKQFFAPRVADGSALKAREDKNQNAFATLVNTLSGAAQKKFSFTAVEKAAKVFAETVNSQWTADIAKNVLPALAAKRHTYNDIQKAQNIAAAVKDAAAAWASTKADPRQRVQARCTGDFSEFAHFNYWIAEPQFHALWQQLGAAPGTGMWCMQTFWYKNQDGFTKAFRDTVAAHCPLSGQQLLCAKLEHYESCLALMGSVGQQAQCVANKQAIGNEVAQKIKAHFASKGSKYACTAGTNTGANAPVALSCTRPAQVYHCDKYYKEHYGPAGSTPLPVKVLDCALGTLAPAYKAKQDKTWNETIPALLKTHPGLKTYVSQKGYDPLVIGVSSALFAELEADAQKHGLDKKIVMSWEPSIDGVDKPTLASNIGPKLKESAKDTIPANALSKEALGGVNPPDPAGKLSAGQVAGNAIAKPGNLAPGAGAQPVGQTKPLSGEMPPGFGPQAKPAAGPLPATPTMPLLPALADLTSDPGVQVGPQQARWGGVVNVDASQARRQTKGICEFSIRHVARNAGKGPAAAFSRQWTNSAVPGVLAMEYPPMPANGAVERTDTLPLKPGMNALTLWLDHGGKVAEQLETNNQFVVRVNVAGNCGTIPARRSPDVDNRPAGPSRPAAPTR